MKKTLLFALLSFLSFNNLRADCLPFEGNNLFPKSSISYSTGGRCDEYRVIEKDFIGENFTGSNKEKYKDIDIWQVGFQATLAIPGCYTDCGWDWLSQFYVDGYAYWGTVGNGGKRYIDFYLPDGTFNGGSKRNARSGSTYDYQISLGWLYAVTCEFGLAPVVGYSWDHQTLRPSSLISFDLDPTPATSIAEYYKYDWKGPFLGLELVYDLCDIRFDAGYEHHWVRSSYSLNSNRFDVIPVFPTCTPKSQKAHDHHAHAHVGYVGATWDICDCWALKLQGKYRNYWAGSETARNNPELTEDCGIASYKPQWHSWEITFDIAYRF